MNDHTMICVSKARSSSKYVDNIEKHLSYKKACFTACSKHPNNNTVYAHNSYMDEHISQ